MGAGEHQRSRARRWRRAVLGGLALGAVALPGVPLGCTSSFDPISKIQGLRVLTVQSDKPYAQPGDTVHFDLTYTYAAAPDAGAPPVQITWIGGCVDPTDDAYYACFSQLAKQFGSGTLSLGTGPTFEAVLPSDLISKHPPAMDGTQYGEAFFFFAACAGTLKPVAAEGNGAAGSFPFGCFDASGQQLGADSFVPGYTQIYAFADKRTAENPALYDVTFQSATTTCGLDAGLDATADGAPDGAADGGETVVCTTLAGGVDVDAGTAFAATACDVSEEERKQKGCGKQSGSACVSYVVDVVVPDDVAQVDTGSKDANGNPLLESVWVDYFADDGDFSSDVKLVSDATTGVTSDHSTTWVPPPTPGLVRIWAVLHTSRGGVTVAERDVMVQ